MSTAPRDSYPQASGSDKGGSFNTIIASFGNNPDIKEVEKMAKSNVIGAQGSFESTERSWKK